MAQTSVAQFASELKVPPSVLLEQLRAAGVDKKQPDDSLSEQDKSRLLEYLRRMHGSAEQKNKITLTRKQTSEIRKTDATGKYRTVQVEVRKKRVFVKRDPAEVAAQGVKTRDDLADLAVDELSELTGMDDERAKGLIMAARAHWFADEAAAVPATQPAPPPQLKGIQ